MSLGHQTVANRPSVDLRSYEQLKFELGSALRVFCGSLPENDRRRTAAEEVIGRLAEDRFNLALVGRFSRGKTTLLNALLGARWLPTSLAPTTSAITTVSHGSRARASIRFQNGRLPTTVDLEAVGEYVSQQGNPGNAARIETVDIQLPVELLRRGFVMVDTPGLGSPIAANTATTTRFLPDADAFVLVTSYDGVLSEDELLLLRSAAAAQIPVFVVVNKQDVLPANERAAAMSYIESELARIDGEQTSVFSISALDGLVAKERSDAELLRQSGIETFESAIVRFLLERKRATFLTRMCERTLDLLRSVPLVPDATLMAAGILELASGLGAGGPDSGAPRPVSPEPATTAIGNLRCEICDAALGQLFAYLRRRQYDLSLRREAQLAHAEAGGFCSFHTWQYEALASPEGVAAAYAPLLSRVCAQLRRSAIESAASEARGELSSVTGCPACGVQERAESEALVIAASRENDEGAHRTAIACLPHLQRLVPLLAPGRPLQRLLEHQATALERLSDDLQRFSLKQVAMRRSFMSEEEKAAPHDALSLLAGHRNLSGPPSIDTYL